LQIRRELVDLARHLFGPRGPGSCEQNPGALDDSAQPTADQTDPDGEPSRLLAWTDMHEQIDHLPEDLREVFELKYYHELTNAEIADLLGVSTRTVRQRWRDARLTLRTRLQGHWPEL